MRIRFSFAVLWTLAAVLLCAPVAVAQESSRTAGWPMRSHNVRRTGQALVNGPRKVGRVWTCKVIDGSVINIEAAAVPSGVFFGTWGIMREHGTKLQRDKFDGKLIGLNRRTGRELWKPLHPGVTPYAYRYSGRQPTAQDRPAGPGLHLNWSNGTIEGTAAVDPKTGTLYVGRGDGTLFAVDPKPGRLLWRFHTLDPGRPKDPEGGGEIVGGPLVTNDGTIVCATFAAPHRPDPPKRIRHETNAVYAVSRDGKMKWRYPESGTVEAVFSAPPALSADGRRVYAVTGLPDKKFPCECFAIDLKSGRLAWKLKLGTIGGYDIAVGKGGVLYVAGSEIGPLGDRPAAFAIHDRKTTGEILWGPVSLDGFRPKTQFAGGIALRETRSGVQDVFVSTSGLRNLNADAGALHRLDPKTGKVTATWQPAKASPPCVGFLSDVSLDVAGTIYVGVRGQFKTLVRKKTNGRMYCVRFQRGRFGVVWSHEVDGQIDWASPAIGPDGGLFFGSSAAPNALAQIRAHPPKKNVPGLDPIFYGIRE